MEGMAIRFQYGVRKYFKKIILTLALILGAINIRAAEFISTVDIQNREQLQAYEYYFNFYPNTIEFLLADNQYMLANDKGPLTNFDEIYS